MNAHVAIVVFSLVTLFTFCPRFSDAAEESAMPTGYGACAGDDAQRLAFLSDRLEGRRRYATNYMRGWLSFYTIGFGASTYRAVDEDDRGERSVHALSAAKAVFGIGRMLYEPPYARLGIDGIVEGGSPASAEVCAADVAEAEERLKKAAHQAGRRWRWKSHVFNLALHSIGALAVGEGFDARKQAWVSAGIGAAVGETVIFTFPWHAEADYAEYQEKFPRSGVMAGPRLAWGIAPTPRGVALELRF